MKFREKTLLLTVRRLIWAAWLLGALSITPVQVSAQPLTLRATPYPSEGSGEAGLTQTILVRLDPTEPGTNYLILSSEQLVGDGLSSGNWGIERYVAGADAQGFTEILIPMRGRAQLFLMGGRDQDSDGDGLPDIYEEVVTGTDPEAFVTGILSDSDAEQDPDEDGWSNLEEMHNGTDPNAFDVAPAPQSVSARVEPGGSTVVVDWDRVSGPILGYAIERQTNGNTFDLVATVGAEVNRYEDDQVDLEDYILYRVRAIYPGGDSFCSAPAEVNHRPLNWVESQTFRGPEGKLYLALKAAPGHIAAVRLRRMELEPVYVDLLELGRSSVELELFTNGVYAIPDSLAPAFGSFQIRVAPIDHRGDTGLEFIAYSWGRFNDGRVELIPFIDAGKHLRQNARFLLRMTDGGQPFHCAVGYTDGFFQTVHDYEEFPDYVYSGYMAGVFSPSWRFDPFQPVMQNHFWRNFLFHPDLLDETGALTTGAGYNVEKKRWEVDSPEFVFSPNRYILAGGGVIPSLLDDASGSWLYWGKRPVSGPIDRIGMSFTSNTFSMGHGHANLYGLAQDSVRILARGTNTPWSVTLEAGESHPRAAYFAQYFNFYSRVQDPMLGTVGYYFARPADERIGFKGDPLPGDREFDVNGTEPPLIIAPVGKPFHITAWARQRLHNGTPGKFAFVQQYFDKALKIDPYGQRTTREVGILSEYGEFFPTEPGRILLTTKPDPEQANAQGEIMVHAIKLEVDLNHDGIISRTVGGPDTPSSLRPLRFWINNDNDAVGVGTEVYSPGQPDSMDREIKSQRDLEDFARLWISGLPELATEEGYQVSLHWRSGQGPTIRLYDAFEIDGGIGYRTDGSTAEGILSVSNYHRRFARATLSPGASYTFPFDFFAVRGRKHFLFEGVEAGRGELVLEIRRGGELVANTSVHIRIQDIQDMYERAHLEGVNTVSPFSLRFLEDRSSHYVVDHAVPVEAVEVPQLILFVHGWRLDQADYESFAETMFKRLWWQGYEGRFAALRWPTHSQETAGALGQFFTFNRSEYIAFKSGLGTSRYLDRLRQRFPDYSINVISHSLGGMVVLEALKNQLRAGSQAVDTYALMQTAVAAHCYDPLFPDLPDFNLPSNPTPDIYRWYPGPIHKAVRNSLINFFNPVDFALVTGAILGVRVSWERNQIDYKPDAGFGYITDATRGWNTARILRPVTDPHELMSFCSRPRSAAVGAVDGVGREIAGGEVDLNADFGLAESGPDHSAQFTWPIQDVAPLYRQICLRLGVTAPEQAP